MQLYPENALQQLEFDKIISILSNSCQSPIGKEMVDEMRIHTHPKYIQTALSQTQEYKFIKSANQYFPSDFVVDIRKDLKLLGIPGAQLTGEQCLMVRKLADHIQQVFRWFDAERKDAFANLYLILDGTYYEKQIIDSIDAIIDERGNVKDNASEDLAKIRTQLFKTRQTLRRVFEKVVAKLAKSGYTADIDESFSNGRRVVAVFSEYKRQVKGFFHGESDSRKTAFIEPEETIELNNAVYSLEYEETKEVQKILRELTKKLSIYASLLKDYLQVIGLLDFIQAKAKLSIAMNAHMPNVVDKAIIDLKEAYHPLLYLYNKQTNKPTIPVTILLNEKGRIVVISGPNAGGKTVTMKTIGLNQLMMQSGLLVPVQPTSQMGIFKQLFIHIGDTQSLEFELSTYSSHLLHMKHFLENANGKTLFFIDELGSGSDPNLGGAFAEVIMEELGHKHAMGIVTTHYLNLKVMANHTQGIVNAAMAFDEKKLLPLYKLMIGKPGSSYTFAIAERIGLPKHLITKARNLVDEDHFKLDKLLNNTEQNLQKIDKDKTQLHQLVKQNEKLQKEMEVVINKEKHKQQVELLKHQNKHTETRIAELKDLERKLKQIVLDYKKATDKKEVIKNLENLIFKKNETIVVNKLAKKVNSKFNELNAKIEVGVLVKSKKNYQVGEVLEIRGKKAVVQIGMLPMQFDIVDLICVEKIIEEEA
jgi:DNA mismatch repair protein MutS2